MLNCQEITETASDFVDGAMPWHVRLQVRLHLVLCRFCREYVRQLGLVVGTLQRLPREQASDELERQLLAVFRSERP